MYETVKGRGTSPRAKLAAVLVTVIIGALLAAGALTEAVPGQGGAVAAAGCGAWTPAAGPNLSGAGGQLRGLAVISPTDVWAVGYTTAGGISRTLDVHWDGSTWSVVPSPNLHPRDNYLWSVSAIAANDIWAVGEFGPRAGPQTLALHWDGSQWLRSPSVDIDAAGNALYSVVAIAPNDVWAVGARALVSRPRVLAEHFDGTRWSVTDPQEEGLASAFIAVAAAGPRDVWAVGYLVYVGPSGTQGLVDTLVERWNGTEWIKIDKPRAANVRYRGVMALSPRNVWAVGTNVVGHFDGNGWTQQESPEGIAGADLESISAASENDIWAVGNRVAHYDAGRWTLIDVPSVANGSPMHAVEFANSGDAWAVGHAALGGQNMPSLLRFSDPCAQPTQAPTTPPQPEQSPTATATRVPVAIVEIPGTGSRTFPETNRTVTGLFLDYWNNNGGLAQQGYPISEVMGEVSDLDHKPYTVQYFERAVFEYHPENQAPYNVLLSQLGTFQYKQKYPNGAPGQTPNQTDGRFFAETGHWVGGKFWQYWQSHGGLAQQGYPISEEFTEKSDLNGQNYTVQYFERAVFELHPENQAPFDVLLSQLGTFQYRSKYGGR